MKTNQCDIGLIGLAVMGENLVLNMESKGFQVAVFNRTTAVTEKFAAGRGQIDVGLAVRREDLQIGPDLHGLIGTLEFGPLQRWRPNRGSVTPHWKY